MAIDTLERRVSDLELRLHGNFLPGALRSAHMPVIPETYLHNIRRDLALTLLGIGALYLVLLLGGYDLEIMGVSTAGPLFWLLLVLPFVVGQYAFRHYEPALDPVHFPRRKRPASQRRDLLPQAPAANQYQPP